MSYTQQYVELDGSWHAIGWGEHTQCGIVIPMGSTYGPLPDKAKAHCGPGTKIAESETKAATEPEPEAAPTEAAAYAPVETTEAVPKAKGGKVS